MKVPRAMRVLGSLLLVAAACHPPGWGKEEPPADAAAPDGAPSPDGPIPIDGAAVTCDADFRLDGHGGAVSVWLTGDFVGWAGQPADGAIALTLDAGAWKGAHTFAAGSYQYKFIVDGASWIPDPGNPNTIDDGFGGTNSVYTCD